MPADIEHSLKKMLPLLLEARKDNLCEADTVARLVKVFEEVLGWDAMHEIGHEVPLNRYYRVWNVEQVELLEKARARFQVESSAIDPIAEAERIIAEMPNPPAIEYHGWLAFYRPATDTVVLPPRETFISPEGFYQSIYHELIHAVGHSKRLNRPGITESIHFGSERYGREELISELGAAFLCAAGIGNATIENHAAYLKEWLAALRADKRAIVHAAAQAQKAADYILNRPSGSE